MGYTLMLMTNAIQLNHTHAYLYLHAYIHTKYTIYHYNNIRIWFIIIIMDFQTINSITLLYIGVTIIFINIITPKSTNQFPRAPAPSTMWLVNGPYWKTNNNKLSWFSQYALIVLDPLVTFTFNYLGVLCSEWNFEFKIPKRLKINRSSYTC